MIMEKLEKVELVREKCGVTYEEAKRALEENDFDVLDAIVYLERQGKASTQTASFATASEPAGTLSAEMARAQNEYHEQSKKTKFGEMWATFCAQAKSVFRAGLDMTFIAERKGERVIAVPLLFIIIGILAWGAALWFLIFGLFFGFRYRIEGASPLTIDVNEAMDKAADVADGLKNDFTSKDE
ncbi:MAG: DUF4342 domain-containing protein [Atopobiaceae bacterium]|nr:DUF4342 domain-containing protein [Atopobiaceae bacterium]